MHESEISDLCGISDMGQKVLFPVCEASNVDQKFLTLYVCEASNVDHSANRKLFMVYLWSSIRFHFTAIAIYNYYV